MTVKVIRLLFGSRDYRILPSDSEKAVNILARSGANYRSLRMKSEGLTFTLELRDCAALERILRNNNIEFEVCAERGLPFLIKKYRRRIGIPIGALLFALMMLLSEKVIWSFEVVGNEDISSKEVLERLDRLGCGLGSYIPSIDFTDLHATYLLTYDDTAWISVNMHGTHAVVEVRETDIPETVTDDKLPHNLVASQDAVIYSIEIHRGIPVVGEGDLVKKGELLASGLVDIKSGYLTAHARGEVKGVVEREIHIEVPLENCRFEPTGREFCERYFNIFGISVKFFGNTGNMNGNYDKIRYEQAERSKMLSCFGDIEVPVQINERAYIEYAEVPIVYTEDEAGKEAFRQLSEAIRTECADAELIEKETKAGMQDGAFVIDCRLTLICDIAAEQPIYTDNTQEK